MHGIQKPMMKFLRVFQQINSPLLQRTSREAIKAVELQGREPSSAKVLIYGEACAEIYRLSTLNSFRNLYVALSSVEMMVFDARLSPRVTM